MAPEPPPHQNVPSTPLTIESVAFATGSGRLVRRPTTVLFDPTGKNTKLTSAFDDAGSDDDAVSQVLASLLEADLGLDAFAIVRWSTDLELIVFGDVALETSVPSAPLISGASSATWVSHRIDAERFEATGSIQVSSGSPVEPDTNLRLGIAACDGFRLNLAVEVRSAADTSHPGPHNAVSDSPVSDSPVSDSPVSDSPLSDSPVSDTHGSLSDQPTARIEPIALDEPPAGVDALWIADAPQEASSTAPPIVDNIEQSGESPIDMAEAPDTGQLDVGSDQSDPSPPVEPSPEAPTNESLHGAPSPEAPANETPLEAGEGDPFAIHDPTPRQAPGSTTNELLEFDADAPDEHVADAQRELDELEAPKEAPPGERAVGTLIFDRFPDSPIGGPAVLGRRPAPGDDRAAIIVDHPEVSRNHAELQIDGWSVTLIDLESRNGTWVQPPNGEQVRRLDPGEAVVLMPGTIVHLGSAEVAFTWAPT